MIILHRNVYCVTCYWNYLFEMILKICLIVCCNGEKVPKKFAKSQLTADQVAGSIPAGSGDIL